MKIARIAEGVNVGPLLWELQRNPQLWNRDTRRTASPESPHHEVDDIWVRYAAPENVGKEGPHESVWYACESVLPPVKTICQQLMVRVKGERLGGVLITRIRAGKSCKPHRDEGWHAEYYRKVAVQVQSAPGQRFCFEGEALETKPGDVFVFNNSFLHWVVNPTEYDRVTLIVCIRPDEGV